MMRRRKLIVTGVIVAALAAGGTGAAIAADAGAHGGSGKGKQTEVYRVAHKKGDGSEKGLSSITKDDGKPSLNRDGTPPSHGGAPDTHSYRVR